MLQVANLNHLITHKPQKIIKRISMKAGRTKLVGKKLEIPAQQFFKNSSFLWLCAFILCTLCTTFLNQAHAAEVVLENCGAKFRVSVSPTITIDNLGRLAAPLTASGTIGGVSLWPFDSENRPVQNDWTAVGVILANSGDIGSESTGGVIWIQHSDHLLARYKLEPGAAAISFWSEKNGISCSKTLRFEIKPNLEISFGDKTLGKLRP
jgi:hypothetical protein